MGLEIVLEQYGATTTSAADNTAKNLEADAASGDSGGTSSSQGDAVEISEEGRTLAMKMGGLQESEAESGEGESNASSIGSEESEPEEDSMAVRRIKEQIKQLQEQLKEVQEDETLTEKQKAMKIQEISQQIMELSEQLGKETGAKFAGAIQGTRCKYAK
jgi:hypothetical protein